MQNNPYPMASAPTPQVIYEADQAHVDTVKTVREKLHGICKKKLMHKHVMVRTIDGHQYEGVIVFVDDGNLYLNLAQDENLNRAYYYRFTPYGPVPYAPFNPGAAILPLVLYNLLAITLLT
ncbi:MAG: hypothetical protein K0R57_2254 [Paenibacillaceae bacterium]|jgi:hypothetical protein|nr:hypothetical protein [Paenibacillaceae bacterium]